MIGPQHVCALYLATAGLQGPALGSDEEEAVLLVYVVIDVPQNKVIGAQQYLVKPNVADVNENVLSEQLTTGTLITEDLVKSAGQPLDAALRSFDHYVRSLGVDPCSAGFHLITDGQLPLRQCLHPEACTKDLELPPYYCTFYDLRKEVTRFLGPGKLEEPIQNIKEVLTYLNMSPDLDNEFYVKEAKDMVNIVQRLVSEGHRFEAPETINLVLEPGICSKDDEIDGNCVVRARGLPWQSSDQDIAKFFRGLNVAKGGVALCLSPQGRRNGEALVRFTCQEHRDMALKRHKHHIGARYIEVYRASGEDFLSVAGGASCEAQAFLSRGAQVIVRMRGLPYDCTPKQVLEFFASGEQPCTVLDGPDGVLFVKKPDGRATGDAFVLFAEESDAPKALAKHRELIGSRYIELFRSTTAEVQQVLNRSMDPKTYEQPQPLIAQLPQVPLLPQHIITSGTRKDCIRLRGLPYEAQVEHILDFLGEHAKSIVFQGVHMVYNAQGQPSGEAFIQMDSEHSAFMAAQQRHHRYMVFGKKQRYIEVFQCSGEDMNLVLTGGIPAPVSPAKAATAALLSPGGSMLPPPYHPGAASFSAYGPVQIAAAPPMGPRQFYPPPIFYWPYPSPPVSPTSYYAPPPGALPAAQQQQAMMSADCLALPPMAGAPVPLDARGLPDTMSGRPDHDKGRPPFGHSRTTTRCRRSTSDLTDVSDDGVVSTSMTSLSRPSSPRRRGSMKGGLAYLASRRGSRDSLASNVSNEDIGPLNFQNTARGRQRRTSNFLELPVPDHIRPRVCSLPEKAYNPRHSDDLYRLRTFSITNKGGVVNCGDSIINRRSRSNTSVNSTASRASNVSGERSPFDGSCCGSGYQTVDSTPLGSPEEREIPKYRVVLLGESGVGKTALVSQFMTSEYMNTYDASLDDEFGEKTVSILLDGEESEMIFIDHPAVEMSVENSLSTYEPHACVVIYSITARESFQTAEEILNYLWRERYTQEKSVIVVANKADLARSRVISANDGKALAVSRDCKFIETSSGIQHNVDELLVGILKQIRLRECRDRKQQQKSASKRDNHKLHGSKTSLSLNIAREILQKICMNDISKSKSCENLHVL